MVQQITGGCNGKVLRVNLTSGTITTENIEDAFYRKYLGGAGFIAYYLLKELKPGIDPLGPDNKLIFALGPLTGLAFPGSARHTVGAKSPLTGGIAKSEVGEYWGSQFKRAGFDTLILEGKAEKPVYLWIHNGDVEIRDAGHLWGKDTKATQETIRSELADTRIRVAMIGPGGENMVRYACLMHGCYDAAGRIITPMHEAGIPDHVFTPRPDHGNPDPGIGKLGPYRFLGRLGVFTPEMSGVPDFNIAIVNPEINRFFRFSFQDEGVKTGAFEL